MQDATRGEPNSPDADDLECSGAGRCKDPRRVVPRGGVLRYVVGWGGARAD